MINTLGNEDVNPVSSDSSMIARQPSQFRTGAFIFSSPLIFHHHVFFRLQQLVMLQPCILSDYFDLKILTATPLVGHSGNYCIFSFEGDNRRKKKICKSRKMKRNDELGRRFAFDFNFKSKNTK